MLTKVLPIEELKQLFIETLLNKTDKVTKVSDGSVLNGTAFGVGKIGQKTLKDIAVVESHLFPDSAYGVYLDNIAVLNGVSPRMGVQKSSMYVKLFATPGTQYLAGVHTFSGNQGVVFDLEANVTVPSFGFIYAKVRSQQSGSRMNVEPLSINKVSPVPSGHIYCINEYTATGGLDAEDDDSYRERIKTFVNQLSRETLSYLDQVFMKINPNVLKVFHYGFNANNKVRLAVATVNGIDLSGPELNDLLVKADQYLSLTELRPSNGINNIGVVLENVSWFPVDIAMRVDIDNSYDVDDVRKRLQVALNKEFDYRFWNWKNKVEWDNLLQIAKNTEGITYVADKYFYPNKDIVVPKNQLPRVRGFMLLDLNGNIINNFTGTLNPIYYPNQIDFAYQADVLSSI